MNYFRLEGFESLEPRMMLDGNLTVNVVDHVLNIHGDALDNSFELRQFDTEQFVVFGVNSDGDKPTTVNGLSQQLFVGVKGIHVRLGNGNDFAFFNGDVGQGAMQSIEIAKDLRFVGGNGSDNFLTEDLTVRGNVTVHGGRGPDFIQLIDSTVNKEVRLNGQDQNDLLATFRSLFRGNVFINAGNGIDEVFNGSSTLGLEGSTFRKNLGVNLSSGNDKLELADSVLIGDLNIVGGDQVDGVNISNVKLRDGDVRINTKGGNDTISHVNVVYSGSVDAPNANAGVFLVSGGPGNDKLEIDNVRINNAGVKLRVAGDTGKDSILIKDSNLGSNGIRINTGGDNDKVEVVNSKVKADETTVMTGDGDDRVFIVDSFFDISFDLNVDLGQGNDLIVVDNSRLRNTDETRVSLGEGDDRTFIVDSFFDVFTELTIDGETGNDVIDMRDTRFKGGGEGRILTADGNDLLKFANVQFDFSKLFINIGDGNDEIRIDRTRSLQGAGEVRIRTGAGDDEIEFLNSLLAALEKIYIDMEEGDDGLFFDDETGLGSPLGRRFLGGSGDDLALPPARGTYFFDEFESFRTLAP